MTCGLNLILPGSCSQPARGVYPCGGKSDNDPLCELHASLASERAAAVVSEIAVRRAEARLRGGGDYVPPRRSEKPGMYPAMQKGD